jgi:NAD(P)-dependent dehydrogenase (short-subunit alcohol dehydrogenase family)
MSWIKIGMILCQQQKTLDLISVPEDISREDICVDLVDQFINVFNRLDVMINNAGISGPKKSSAEMKSEDWDRVIGINLKG